MKYSITIPAYKASFLQECIDSVLSQSYSDFELIIVDDASPQNIGEIVFRYNDSRIRYYRNKENCGAVNVVDNWNICLSYAQGEYVICMGDDDRLLPNCLETYNALIDEYPDLDVYHGFTEIIDETSSFIGLQEARPQFESVYSLMWHRWNGRNQFIGDFLFRTVALRRHGGFYKLPLAWASDDISVYMIAMNRGIANTQIPVFQYRKNSQTISLTGDNLLKIKAVKMEESWTREFLMQLSPNSELDRNYKILLEKQFLPFFYAKRYKLLLYDMRSGSCLKFFDWFSNREKLGISKKEIVRAYLSSLKSKLLS